ncbi:hypothetical protein [Solimonas sp. SE-A11]|uniref:hypothetical protein n=1 Tax=Solimonas sp. SE-A11 TaxID=3054954 RepID=UPI00259D27D5|nr:hypothetical protein [Solimonas sp. SE-A11]MDM4768576.1 hypothetical protein [Solimonas sp. SE-A11]
MKQQILTALFVAGSLAAAPSFAAEGKLGLNAGVQVNGQGVNVNANADAGAQGDEATSPTLGETVKEKAGAAKDYTVEKAGQAKEGTKKLVNKGAEKTKAGVNKTKEVTGKGLSATGNVLNNAGAALQGSAAASAEADADAHGAHVGGKVEAGAKK